jgi:hypothetical protein
MRLSRKCMERYDSGRLVERRVARVLIYLVAIAFR